MIALGFWIAPGMDCFDLWFPDVSEVQVEFAVLFLKHFLV
jgi:hypothetical protein